MLELATSDEELGEQIAELAAQLHAATARFLRLIGEFDEREAWGAYGIKSCAHWLSWRCGLSPGAAREHVRVARGLRGLPLIAASFARGELSYSKVRALTRIANDTNENQLHEWSRYGTAAQIEYLVRGFRRARANGDPMRARARRSLSWFYDDDGSLVVKARLAPEDGALFLRAIEEAEKRAEPPSETGGNVSAETFHDASSPWDARRADALVALAETYFSGDSSLPDLDRTLVVLNVDEATLRETPTLRPGAAVTPETARRLACDAGLIRATDGGHQTIGRKTRVVPTGMRRALHRRDRSCRFPACTSRRTDAHHIVHWARGGDTSLRNLVLLCRHHHRLVHEGGFHVELAGSAARFYQPGGRLLEARTTPSEARDLIRANRREGVETNVTTCASHWDGRPPDYNIAVEGLFLLARADTS